MGYYVLFKLRIGSIDGLSHKPEINKLGIYYSRYGKIYKFPVKSVIAKHALTNFTKWFKERIIKEYGNLLHRLRYW